MLTAKIAQTLATGQMKHFYDLLEIYKNVEDHHILEPADSLLNMFGGLKGLAISSLFYGRSYLYKTDPLERIIREHMTDEVWQTIKDSPINAGFCVVNMYSGESEVFWSNDHDPETLRLAILASASQPILMEPVVIDGIQYCDGGLLDFVPVRFASNSEVIAISTQQAGAQTGNKLYKGLLPQLERVLEIFVSNVYEHNRRTCMDAHVTYYEPSVPMDGDALEFEPEAMRSWVQEGFHDAMRTMEGML